MDDDLAASGIALNTLLAIINTMDVSEEERLKLIAAAKQKPGIQAQPPPSPPVESGQLLQAQNTISDAVQSEQVEVVLVRSVFPLFRFFECKFACQPFRSPVLTCYHLVSEGLSFTQRCRRALRQRRRAGCCLGRIFGACHRPEAISSSNIPTTHPQATLSQLRIPSLLSTSHSDR